VFPNFFNQIAPFYIFHRKSGGEAPKIKVGRV